MIFHTALRILIIFSLIWNMISLVDTFPADREIDVESDDQQFVQEYADLKHSLIYDFGYTKEFADLVEVNLKRAVKEERARQKLEGIVPGRLRQGQQGAEEYDDDESTTPAITTPGASPGDVVKGIAGIVTSLGTLNVRNFWQSFVNFFPPNHRESAQALVDASLGRRPAQWPTLPTTTTKLTTSTKDEDEIDSEETTKSAVGATSSTILATTPAGSVAVGPTAAAAQGATPAVVVASVSTVTEAITNAPTTRYTLIRRSGTVFPDNEGLRVDDLFLGESAPTFATTSIDTTTVSSVDVISS